MIIDDDYCQYDTFRIINKADVDAIAQFNKDNDSIIEPAMRLAALNKWQAVAEEERRNAESTEESVYSLTFAERMVTCWTNALK